MKKLIMILLIASSLMAQDFTGIRIYINPGHGGHDSDDRFIPETGFWESESNLSKGLELREILLGMNATIKMSRTTNYSSDDLPLSVIDADANNFDADFFHSIHSNGYNGQSNYTLILYKEVNGQPAFSQAKTMADIMKLKIFKTNRTTTSYSRGDYSFLGFNLGVLRTLNMPGTLSEGSFHDYLPESYRLLNEQYKRHEAWGIARSLVDYFNLSDNGTGIIAGIARDPQQSVSYYSISSTNDGKKPVNYIKATLLPDSLVYLGDDKNNGFYFFDSLAPGNYTLVIEGENYAKDTIAVTAVANTSKFYDVWMYEEPDYSVPNIVNYSPGDNSTDVSLFESIVIDFDIRMDKTSVQNAFEIVPSASGSFTWENNDKCLIFEPDPKWAGNTQYTITITNDAKSAYGTNIDASFNLSFTTRAKLNLLEVYPKADQSDVSTSVMILIQFDTPIDAGTLSGNVLFTDPDGNFVPIVVDQKAYAQGIIKFEPIEKLERGTEYSIELKEGIGDTEGLKFGESYSAKFRTSSDLVVNGNLLDDFEVAGSWMLTNLTDVTYGIVPGNTLYEKASKSYSGSYSGRLKYEFSDSLAAAGAVNSSGYSMDGIAKLGVFVFGDYTFNQIDFIFTDSQNNIITVPVDTLDYTGWKIQEVNLNDLGFTPQMFYGVQVVNLIESNWEGEIYIDDLQTDFTTGVNENSDIPVEYELAQNYPNPFNPSTVIEFSLKNDSQVKLSIYNLLGEKVATLANNELMKKGRHKISWNAGNLSSGVYFYRIETDKFTDTKKMLLIR